jgi:hypothetical protein
LGAQGRLRKHQGGIEKHINKLKSTKEEPRPHLDDEMPQGEVGKHNNKPWAQGRLEEHEEK